MKLVEDILEEDIEFILFPFLMHGGDWKYINHSGVFASFGNYGAPSYRNGFRPVLINN